MLKHLFIENYALIDRLDIGFNPGFTAITGETGSGKSILMDALDLVLGKRADTQILADTDRKCIVEGTFRIAGYDLKVFFDESGLDHDDDTVLRREIYPNGKSRAFINDTPVNLTQLKMLGDKLIDIHAQHATTSLQDPAFQLSVIDSFAGLNMDLDAYQQLFHTWNRNIKILQDLQEKENAGRSGYDYKKFLLDELASAQLMIGEQEELENQHSLLTHAEEIKSNLYRILELFENEETGVILPLSDAEASLKKISAYHTGFENLSERLSSNLIDLKEICRELIKIGESIDSNPEQLTRIQQRLDLIYRLQSKHQVKSIEELLDIYDSLTEDLENYSSLEEQIKQQEVMINSQKSELLSLASKLSDARKTVFSRLEEEVVARLRHMGMPECQFEIKQHIKKEVDDHGQDVIEFFFNANKGYLPKLLADIASGGELSRVMLSIKSIVSQKIQLPTIVFDEIDNGISGDIAGRVGDVLARAAQRMQVIVITHLPQIAGKATHQYAVFKQVINNITYSKIKALGDQDRLEELAKMIGGKDTTPASLAAARELMGKCPEIVAE